MLHQTVSTSYTAQAVSNDSLHVPIKHIHNCSSKPRMLPDASENQNQHSQTGKHSPLTLPILTHSPLSTNDLNTKFHRAFSAMMVPTFLSLSLSLSTPVPKLPGQPNCLKLQLQGQQCKRPSSPTVPAHYRTSGVQLLTSYLNTTFTSYSCVNPTLS